MGGRSSSVTNAPTIIVTLKDLKAAVTWEVKPGSDPSVDNVSMWAGVDSLQDEWSYTVVASMPPEEYTQAANRSPVLYDPLNNNKTGNNWEENADCGFAQGAYHVDGGGNDIMIRPDGNIFYTTCTAQTANFSNFAYQIQMKFVSPGCAGIIFRANLINNNYHYDIFRICDNGSYWYSVPEYFPENMDFSQGIIGASSAIHTQLNQSNTITAIAIGNSIRFFMYFAK